MEPILQTVNRDLIALKKVKTYNSILKQFINNCILQKLKKIPLFKKYFLRIFYGGSFYDGLRVQIPSEFDLYILFKTPVEEIVELGERPGFVRVNFSDEKLYSEYSDFHKAFVTDNFLDALKLRAWLQSLITKILNDFTNENGETFFKFNRTETFLVKISQSGPALTFHLQQQGINQMVIDIDFVPCFLAPAEHWPENGFVTLRNETTDHFLLVPKPPKLEKTNLYWRISFQEEERKLLFNKQYLKPAIKLLKKMRDNLNHHPMKSYFIKTIGLHELKTHGDQLWQRKSLSSLFLTLLESYINYLRRGKLPNYWYPKNDLFEDINDRTLICMADEITKIWNEVKVDRKAVYKFFSKNYNP